MRILQHLKQCNEPSMHERDASYLSVFDDHLQLQIVLYPKDNNLQASGATSKNRARESEA